MSRVIDRTPLPEHPREKKVIILSYPRNGTLGLYKAFTILGYNPYHLMTCWEKGLDHIKIAREGLEAKIAGQGKPFGREEFDKWFSENGMCRALQKTVMDIAAFFTPELIKAYPDAKFILTYRNPEAWMRSVENTIMKLEIARDKFPLWHMRQIDTHTREIFKVTHYLGAFLWKRTLQEDKDLRLRERAIKGYEQHNEMVRKMVPAGQLLEIKLEDGLGWEQICPFIGEDIPDVPYPRSNDPQEFKKLVQGFLYVTWMKTLTTYAAMLVPVIGGAIWYLRQRR